MKYEEIYRATIEKWGEEAQYDQAIEECAELITALKHFKRNRVGRREIVSELADLSLMIGQLTWMFGEEEVRKTVDVKLAKLEKLLQTP
ncbi:MAG: antitoxin [Desulfuromonadales bacterium]|nr:antitoxin [Desulfuromonadales bacterium]NIS42836.1 antitoxin [Desulfuromonadales bacterium]